MRTKIIMSLLAGIAVFSQLTVTSYAAPEKTEIKNEVKTVNAVTGSAVTVTGSAVSVSGSAIKIDLPKKNDPKKDPVMKKAAKRVAKFSLPSYKMKSTKKASAGSNKKKAKTLSSKKGLHTRYAKAGKTLTKGAGVFYGPNGKETYYNLPMQGVIKIMRWKGHKDKKYWVRKDGVKMFGDYIMVAASLDKYNRGDIVETSLGKGIICDTGGFARHNRNQFDIAVTW